jgi:hypothetical protein
VAVDVDQGLAVRFPCDDVVIPDLVVKCARPGRGDVDRLALGRQPSRAARRYWKAAYWEATESAHPSGNRRGTSHSVAEFLGLICPYGAFGDLKLTWKRVSTYLYRMDCAMMRPA